MSNASGTNTAFHASKPGAGLEGITTTTTPIPKPQAHEVLVRIHAASVNFRDFAILAGLYPLPLKENVVLGSDMAGEVVELGAGVASWQIGERVTANFDLGYLYDPLQPLKSQSLGGGVDGVLQQYRVFNEDQLIRVPKHLTYEEAACLPCTGVTAYNALFGGKALVPGQTVLIQGTGGVSMTALMLANAAGAKTIITSSSDEKLEFAKKFGATHTINYKTHPDWDKVALQLTGGEGAHHVIDNVGINEIEKCLNAVSYGGTVNCIGFLGGQPKATPNVPMLALSKGANVRGIIVGSKQLYESLLKFVETKELKPHVHKVFKFEETPNAIGYLLSGQHSGKIVVKVAA